MTKTNKIMVQRKSFESKGKSYFTYFVNGNIRGKDVEIAVMPPDFGGYQVLDIVFNGENKAELVIKPYEIKDNNGNVISGNTYAVRSFDEAGNEYICDIKPFRKSDTALLKMLVR